jgi:hypothetical protein
MMVSRRKGNSLYIPGRSEVSHRATGESFVHRRWSLAEKAQVAEKYYSEGAKLGETKIFFGDQIDQFSISTIRA